MTKRSGTVTATRKTNRWRSMPGLSCLIERVPISAAHVHRTAKARLADTQAQKATSPPVKSRKPKDDNDA
jgi:voltage-gated potassium channel